MNPNVDLIRRNKINERNRNTYHYRKTHGKCVRCGEPAIEGTSFCLICKIERREASKRFRDNNPGYYKESKKLDAKRLRKERKAKGLCTECGKRKPTGGYVMCEVCRKKARIKNRNLYKKKLIQPYIERRLWPDMGICYICGSNPTIEGKQLCKDCYDRGVKSLANGRKVADRSYFSGQNKLLHREGRKYEAESTV